MANKNKIINQAQKHIAKGQWDKAIKELHKLVAEDPSDVRTLLKLGDVYSKKGDRDQATKVYKQVAESYSQQGFFLKAVAVYKQIQKHDPKQLDVTLKLAELYEHLGLSSEAMAQYQAAAQIHDDQGATKDSLEVLERMVELDADNVASRIKLAEGYSRDGQTEAAIAQFERAADILKQQSRLDDYVKVAERLVYHAPHRHDVVKELAKLYLTRGDTKRGLAKLQSCFKAQPRDVETLSLLGQAFTDLGQIQKTVFVYHELANVYQETHRTAEARRVLNAILELDPHDARAREGLGLASTASPAASAAPLDPIFSPDRPLTGPRSPTGSEPISAPRSQSATAAPLAPRSAPRPPSLAPRPRTAAPRVPTDDEVLILEPPISSPREAPRAPPPEPAPEQISKILTETDVYVKYGLRSKALEHLRRVFDIDPDNVRAYTKMRDIYMGMGDLARAAEAVANLVHVYARRGDMDSMTASREALEALAPGHPLVMGGLPGGMAPTIPMLPPEPERTYDDPEDHISIDISEDSDVYELVDLAESESGDIEDADALIDSQDSWDLEEESEVSSARPLHRPDVGLHFDDDLVDDSNPFGGQVMEGFEVAESTRDDNKPASSLLDDIGSDLSEDPEIIGSIGAPDPSSLFDRLAALDGDGPLGTEDEDSFVRFAEHQPFAESLEAGQPQSEFEAFEEEPTVAFDGDADDHFALLEPSAMRAKADSAAHDELPEASISSVIALEDSGDATVPPMMGWDRDDADFDERYTVTGFEAGLMPPVPLEQSALEKSSPDGIVPERSATTGAFVPPELFGDEDGDTSEVEGTPDHLDGDAFADPEPGPDGMDEPVAGLDDEIDEAEFFLEAGLEEEARTALRAVLSRSPSNPRALALMTGLEDDLDPTGTANPPALAGAMDLEPPDDVEDALEETDEGEVIPVGAVTRPTPALSMAALRADGSQAESAEDHYDQGMLFREIGRLNEAIEEFKHAARSPSRAITSLELIGHCLIEKHEPEAAIEYFTLALESGAEGAAATNLKYEIAEAWEVAGNVDGAVRWFRACAIDDPHHRHVTRRLAALGAPLDQWDEPAPPNGAYPGQEGAEPGKPRSSKRHKISYL